MAKKGLSIDLRESKKSVEQALRELKMMMEEDMLALKERKYYMKPTAIRRERNKVKSANIRRYNKMR